jgi:hypothetical protein
MELNDLKDLVMLQLGEDTADVEEYETLIETYLQSGYELLMYKRKGGNLTDVKPLEQENLLPIWAHTALADYATYRILITGNSAKQNRAQAFYASFAEILSKLMTEADEAALDDAEEKTGVRAIRFKNLYT